MRSTRLTMKRVPKQVTTAREQWKSEEEGGVDDCTAVVCYLRCGGPSSGDASAAGSSAAGALHTKVMSSNTSISRRAAGPFQSPAAFWGIVALQVASAVGLTWVSWLLLKLDARQPKQMWLAELRTC